MKKTESRVRNRRVHMANERTFLAWIRTSIGIMAFGFVLEKFGFFLKQMTWYMGKIPSPGGADVQPGLSAFLGVILVGLGALMGLMAFVRYKKVERQIDEDSYRPSLLLDALLTLTIIAIGFFLVIYLVHTM
ncbi:MAG: DUF202 domain-containing protein [Desulfomicrobium escambiense]|nr:DUF202 domain-containing protein [Desulfomicrobium escambiense]